jgi:NAD(P)-dependent dehydrogenase (short-subunit alcohol dehydrogenase family)
MAKVVITGANRGIGLALTKKYLSEGHEVMALCRRASEELKATQAKVFQNVDVTDVNSLEKVANELDVIDILINNAGVLSVESIDNMDFLAIQKQIEVNTLAPLKVITTLGKKLKKGSLFGILTSRMGSIEDNDSGGYYGYRLSKAAANAVGKSLAMDLKPQGITVLLLHPGYVKTEMTGQQGLIDTEESARGLFKVIEDHKGLKDTGTFWHANGEKLPW